MGRQYSQIAVEIPYDYSLIIYAVFTRDTFTWDKCHFTIENVTQYNKNVNLPQVNVSPVSTALVS